MSALARVESKSRCFAEAIRALARILSAFMRALARVESRLFF
jgi:hypothetical protein